jgi:hypothetical protein
VFEAIEEALDAVAQRVSGFVDRALSSAVRLCRDHRNLKPVLLFRTSRHDCEYSVRQWSQQLDDFGNRSKHEAIRLFREACWHNRKPSRIRYKAGLQSPRNPLK